MKPLSYHLKLEYLALILFSFFPLLPNRLKGVPVIFLFLATLYLYFTKKARIFPMKFFMLFSSLFLVLLVSLFYTSNLEEIDKLLSTRLSLLIVPISLCFLYSTDRKISQNFLLQFSKFFFFSASIFSIFILLFLFRLGVFSEKMSLYNALAYITNEMWVIHQHPIYASIFISIAILLMVNVWILKKNKTLIIGSFPFFIIQLCTLYILGRKGVLLGLIIGLIIMIYFSLKEKTPNIVLRNIVLTGIVITSVFVFSSERFKELYRKENYTNVLEFNSTSLRFGIYNCGIQKIKESPLFGFGLGDVQNELNNCYREKSNLLTEITHNSHNQYLSYFLSSGIFGFLILLFCMFKTLINAIKKKNIILISLTLFFIIVMMFENILERQSGVILFSFFLCLFNFYNFVGNEETHIKHES